MADIRGLVCITIMCLVLVVLCDNYIARILIIAALSVGTIYASMAPGERPDYPGIITGGDGEGKGGKPTAAKSKSSKLTAAKIITGGDGLIKPYRCNGTAIYTDKDYATGNKIIHANRDDAEWYIDTGLLTTRTKNISKEVYKTRYKKVEAYNTSGHRHHDTISAFAITDVANSTWSGAILSTTLGKRSPYVALLTEYITICANLSWPLEPLPNLPNIEIKVTGPINTDEPPPEKEDQHVSKSATATVEETTYYYPVPEKWKCGSKVYIVVDSDIKYLNQFLKAKPTDSAKPTIYIWQASEQFDNTYPSLLNDYKFIGCGQERNDDDTDIEHDKVSATTDVIGYEPKVQPLAPSVLSYVLILPKDTEIIEFIKNANKRMHNTKYTLCAAYNCLANLALALDTPAPVPGSPAASPTVKTDNIIRISGDIITTPANILTGSYRDIMTIATHKYPIPISCKKK